MNKYIVCIALIIGLIASCMAQQQCCEQNQNILSVQGQGAEKVVANIAEVTVGVEAIDNSVIRVQRNVTRVSNKVIGLLDMMGAKKVTSQHMSIHPQYNYKNDRTRISGYRGVIQVSFEADVKDAGGFIAAAFDAGVNRIHSYTMKADDKVLEAAKHLALRKATLDAMQKGDTVLNTLNLRKKGFKTVNVNSNFYQPLRQSRNFARGGMEAMAMSADAIAPKLTATEQDISATIHLSMFYE